YGGSPRASTTAVSAARSRPKRLGLIQPEDAVVAPPGPPARFAEVNSARAQPVARGPAAPLAGGRAWGLAGGRRLRGERPGRARPVHLGVDAAEQDPRDADV